MQKCGRELTVIKLDNIDSTENIFFQLEFG